VCVRARSTHPVAYLGDHVLCESRVQLERPLAAATLRVVRVIAGAVAPGVVQGSRPRARVPRAARQRRVARGAVRQVRRRLDACVVRLSQEEIVRVLAEADKQRRDPCQHDQLFLVPPEAPEERQHGAVDARQQLRRRGVGGHEAVLGLAVLRVELHHGHRGSAERCLRCAAKPGLQCPPPLSRSLPPSPSPSSTLHNASMPPAPAVKAVRSQSLEWK